MLQRLDSFQSSLLQHHRLQYPLPNRPNAQVTTVLLYYHRVLKGSLQKRSTVVTNYKSKFAVIHCTIDFMLSKKKVK